MALQIYIKKLDKGVYGVFVNVCPGFDVLIGRVSYKDGKYVLESVDAEEEIQ